MEISMLDIQIYIKKKKSKFMIFSGGISQCVNHRGTLYIFKKI